MCFDEEEQETDVEEAARIAQQQAQLDAERIQREQAQAAAARRAQAQADALSAAERRAQASALAEDAEDTELDEDELSPKKKRGKGLASLRVDRASSLGGSPLSAGGLSV